MRRGKRLLIYDRTGGALSASWAAGCLLFRALRRFDASHGVATWGEALEVVLDEGDDAPIAEIQFWGHGSPGRTYIAGKSVGLRELALGAEELAAVRRRLAPGALVWLRTCSAFAGKVGHAYARRLADGLGCTVAAHTHAIGLWHGGLHTLGPDEAVHWPEGEGIGEGGRLLWSSRTTPKTIPFIRPDIPAGW